MSMVYKKILMSSLLAVGLGMVASAPLMADCAGGACGVTRAEKGIVHELGKLIRSGESAVAAIKRLVKGSAVVLDFTATWCGPCQKQKPMFAAAAAQYTDVLFIAVDVDEFGDVMSEYGATAMPTIKPIGKGGKTIAVKAGVKTVEQIGALIAQVR